MSLAVCDDGFDDRMRGPSLTIWLIAGVVAVFVIWAAFACVDEIVRARGQIVSSSRPQIIQNPEGGILAERHVAEGEIVEPGQTVARLYGTNYQAAVDEISDQIAARDIRRLRLKAGIAGTDSFAVPQAMAGRVPGIVASEPALLTARRAEFRARVGGAQAVVEQARQVRALPEDMYAKEVAPLIKVTRARKAAPDAEPQRADAIGLTALERATDYSKTQGDLASLKQKLRLSTDQLARTVLVAPVAPTVKLSANDCTIFGTLRATVTFISADTFKDERSCDVDGDPHCTVTLRVDREALSERQTGLKIKPGMLAEVELRTGGKTGLTYLTRPLYKSAGALRER